MVYDCFIFYNELDLLEIRLNILSPYVDYFVLVEATTTFSGQPKPLFYKNTQERFSKFKHKIIHIIVDDMEKAPDIVSQPPYNKIEVFQQNPTVWSKEFYQRNCLTRGLTKATANDLILIGDVDEIPNPQKIKTVKYSSKSTIFEQDFYYYYLNCQSPENKIHGTRGVYKKFLTTPQEIRIQTPKTAYVIKKSGWHFSYLGGYAQITKKIKSFSHQELNTPEINNLKRLEFNIDNNLDIFDRPFLYNIVKIDKTFPPYIRKNIKKYQKYIKPVIKTDTNTKQLQHEIISNRQKISEIEYDKRCLQQQIINKDVEIQELKKLYLKIDQLQQSLSKIQSSKTYIIWQKFNKIKRAVTGKKEI